MNRNYHGLKLRDKNVIERVLNMKFIECNVTS